MLERKRFRDNGPILPDHPPVQFLCWRTGLDNKVAILGEHGKISRSQNHGLVVVGDVDGAELVDFGDSGDFFQRFHKVGGQSVLVIDVAASGDTDENVGTQGLPDPDDHGLAETVDHDRHADDHHERDGQGGDRQRVASDVLRQVHAGQQTLAAKPVPAKSMQEPSRQQKRGGGEQGQAQNDQEYRQKPEIGEIINRRELGADGGENQRPERRLIEPAVAAKQFEIVAPAPHDQGR